jgi:hypothetical protein
MEVIVEIILDSLLMIPGVREAIAGLTGHLAPPFLITLLILWASGKFLKEDIAGKKFVLAVSDVLSDPDKKPLMGSELIPLVLLVEAILIATTYCAVFGYGVTWGQRVAFAAFGGFGSGLVAYCIATGLYDVGHGVAKHREIKKEKSK